MTRLARLAVVIAIGGLVRVASGVAPVAVCASTADLGALVQEIGGDAVRVTTIARGTEDPHAAATWPGVTAALAAADLLVVNGLDLEAHWLPVALRDAGNRTVLPGAPGYVDAATVVTPLEVPGDGGADRSAAGVHRLGNPHFLLDPVRGVAVAGLIRDALGRVRPDRADAFRSRWRALRERVEIALVGERLAERYDGLRLAELAARGRLDRFLEKHAEPDAVGGWVGALAPYRGARIVTDHAAWAYFARRFGFEVAATLEPAPGSPPTREHLTDVVATIERDGIGVILASAYFDSRHATLVGRESGARVLAMADQVGARPGARDYVSTIGFDVRQLAAGLTHARP